MCILFAEKDLIIPMNNFYNWIIIVIFVFLFGWVIISNRRYEKISDKYDELLKSKTELIDSLESDNSLKEERILKLEKSLVNIDLQLDSVQNSKQEVSKKKFEVSPTLSESVELLKKNLQCVDL